MNDILNRKWWKAACVRSLKTFAEALIALIPAGVAIQDLSWPVILGTSGLAALIAFLTCLAGLPEVR